MIANPKTSTEHHARLMPHVDDLATTGDLVGAATGAELGSHLEAASAFLNGLLVPHMDAAERAYYPELERLMQNRHSMTPMRREHETIRALIAEIDRRRVALGPGALSSADAVALRRALFRLHAILKVHLAEEQLYADIAERGLSADAERELAEAMRHEGIGEL
ncbi:MAG TPA: hemerythrin domain-containing protein [Candidatus Limnocylindrales bacterium]|nr:hemerythrin domain-containing protein [Candidatus Limnocylindrales bacterium]